jgi:hypothetical protein
MCTYKEEEIRSNIIIPFLTEIGLSYNELNLETSFSIQLGRGVYNVKNDLIHNVGGRLDILCKIDGKNLFIIELKAEDVSIDKEKDSHQGLSYARLLQPMPPYVIVTNGKETYLYDTIYGKEVDKNQITINGYHISVEDDILFRFNALKYFIGYSYENLLIFCRSVGNEHKLKFCSLDTDDIETKLLKKYIPTIFVERNGLIDSFNSFIQQNDKNVYAIIGESGCGKTNAIIDLYDRFSDFPSLFYSGTLLGNSFFDEIKFDFNLEFTSQETELAILKKISSLSELHRKQFIFFIDALDEWLANDKSQQLDNLIKIAKRCNIKLCISCKDLMWSSFLSRNGIPTNLTDNLYHTFTLMNFNESEFNKALDIYSKMLQVPITSKEFSPELYNPFSLRIAFEVSHSDQNILLNNHDSSKTIALFINQKLVKTKNKELSKRYLYSIAELLLKNNHIHEEEQLIREYLHLTINDDIPTELYSNSFLYSNSIDNKKYIGFYFSKIRDYIISYEILELNNKNKGERIETIIKTLESFIGVNAVNFFLKNSSELEKSDCIQAFIEYDKRSDNIITTKLLSQQDGSFYQSISNEVVDLIISHLKKIIKEGLKRFNLEDEIDIILINLDKSFNIEINLIEIILLINEFNPANYNIYKICQLLKNNESEIGTKSLIEILINRKIDENIRRFVIDSLDDRKINNRKEIFLTLLNEFLETGNIVYFYIKHWYDDLESIELRDEILKFFDKSPRKLIIETFFYSQLEDTGELLYSRFLNNKYDDTVTWWLCRVICRLDYRKAINKFIQIIIEQPSSELSGHLLIGLGEMKAVELKPTLFNIIKDLPENFNNETWLTHAFNDIMNSDDYLKLLEIAIGSKNIPTIIFAAKTLSNQKKQEFNEFILKCVNNSDIPIRNRNHIFHEWSFNLAVKENISGNLKIEDIECSGNMLNINELDQVCDIFKQNTENSITALSVLLNFEDRIDILHNKILEILPIIHYPIITRRLILINIGNLKKLKPRISNWLKMQLILSHWENNMCLFNCLQLCGILGDFTHVEIIENNKSNILNHFPPEIDNDKIEKDRYLNYIIHIISVSNNKIRTHLEI